MDTRDELAALAADYRGELPRKLAHIELLVRAQRLAELGRALHTLGGSAGSFGLPRLGAAARAAEVHLDRCGGALHPAARAELERLLAVLRHEACTA